MFRSVILTLLLFLSQCSTSLAQATLTPPNSFPHAWPGQPKSAFSPAWQNCKSSSQYRQVLAHSLRLTAQLDFAVKNPLPGLNLTGRAQRLPRSFAGNIPVNRAGHPNNTLFFWGFERQGTNGSLTAPAHANNTEPWIIWLQGGYVIVDLPSTECENDISRAAALDHPGCSGSRLRCVVHGNVRIACSHAGRK